MDEFRKRKHVSETAAAIEWFSSGFIFLCLSIMFIESASSISPISLSLAVVCILIAIAYYSLKDKNLPPGPVGLPYFGYWPFLKNDKSHLQLEQLKKKYGDLFCFTSAGRLYLHLGSFKALREAHINKADSFAGRYTDFNLLSYCFRDGVGFVNGEAWKELRKFFLQILKERGVISVKDSLSGSMYEAIKSAIDFIKEKKGEPINIIELVNNKCNTILRTMLFGDNGMTEEQITELTDLYNVVMMCMTPNNLLLTGNFARLAIFPFLKGYKEAMVCDEKTEKMLYKIIDEHKSTYNEEHVRDIIDDYFKERDVRRSKGDPTAKHFTDKALMSSLKQFVGDGVLAVASFVSLIIKILVEHPEEQKKVYEEIIDVVGVDRQPTVEDKSKLTYTNAFILETLRTSDFFSFVPCLECTRETTLRGFRIPKGTITLMNLYSSHYDSEVYEDPHKFDPSRYIIKDGQRRPELPITFGVGRRSCIGEGFTMMQVFLFLTTIVKNFQLSLPKGEKVATYEELLSGKLLIVAHPRNQK
ncbi:cytochrome P450 2J1 [Caerostris darwini]|uniref:Cytochrome P450 2J1 n=1 Tax=Caerostris darwini TaxID=1538125 RepID=A0AAV4SAR4_9ARAC|nr:cytochrome P450 2J1 [Caerostris darwini]